MGEQHNNKYSTLEQAIQMLLVQTGFRNKLTGSAYLCKAVEIYCKSPAELTRRLTNELYPVVAQDFNTSAMCVERNIRTAIQDSYDRGGLFSLNRIFNCNVVEKNYPPTNADIIMFLANRLHDECWQ